jgi:hypothetical protein
MSDTRNPTARPSQADARKARLAQALRDNLRRRKAQIRGRAGQDQAGPDENTSADGTSPGTSKAPQN